jgi:hypothetical protein
MFPDNIHVYCLVLVLFFLLCSELPVRVEGVMALRSFVEELADVAALKPVLPQLMDNIFNLMNEVRGCVAAWFSLSMVYLWSVHE